MTKIPVYVIDAFTEKVFGGNSAAVCPLEEWPSDERMQLIARAQFVGDRLLREARRRRLRFTMVHAGNRG